MHRDYLLWVLIAALVVLSALTPADVRRYPELVNWPTIATLTGLMILTKGIEASGWLQRVGQQVIARVPTQRRLALFLVAGSALLAMFLTNDITLFIAVPLTLELGALAVLPLRRLVIFEALAVNTGSMLTPIGNPQNIFLWRLSGVNFGAFVWHMLPPFIIATGCLLLVTSWAFSGERHVLALHRPAPVVRARLLITAAVLYVPFLVLADLHFTAAALALVAVVFVIGFPRLLREVDWPLIVIFVLMFVDLGRLAQYPVLAWANLAERGTLYAAGALSAQVISNVPAAILLSHYSRDWGTIAWAVDVGGLGIFIASLANIIALRLGRQRGALLAFHVWSLPIFIVVGGLVWLWLEFR